MHSTRPLVTALLGLGTIALARPSHAQIALDIQRDMYHQYGAFSDPDNAWKSYTSTSTERTSFSTYGPFGSWNDAGAEIVIGTGLSLVPDAGKTVNAVWDIFDNNVTYFRRTYSAQGSPNFLTAWAVVRVPNHSFQARTRPNGWGTVYQGNVIFWMESQDKTKDIWPAIEQAAYHEVGVAMNAADWRAGPGSPGCSPDCVGKFLTYGPYISADAFNNTGVFRPYWLAVFHLQTDRGAGTATQIATIDVVYSNSSGATVTLKSADITGYDFQANNVMTGLPIDFTIPNPSPTTIEFRTRMRGTGVVTQSDTKIFRSR